MVLISAQVQRMTTSKNKRPQEQQIPKDYDGKGVDLIKGGADFHAFKGVINWKQTTRISLVCVVATLEGSL